MENYLKEFNSHSEYETFKAGTDFIRPNVSICNLEDDVHYNGHDYSKDYLTFRILEDGTVTFRGVPDDSGINYSKDNGQTWSSIGYTSPLTVSKGDKVLFKATNPTFSSSGMGHFGSTCKFTVEGNIMSLHFGDNFENLIDLTGKNNAFKYLFVECTNLILASKLILPAITLANTCYSGMFKDCTSLTTAPKLPATTLVNDCYESMFNGCTSLTTAPDLPATTLAFDCYGGMFSGCTSLTTAPQLPATTLANYCYLSMFSDCTRLTMAPELPATTLASYCYAGMFSDCTRLTMAPELPATALKQHCYGYMFYNCTSLNSVTCLATNISASNCTNNWVSGVASSGTFTKAASMTSWETGVNGIPNGWTVVDASA